jgi:site-specific DNA recombinase
MALRGAAYARYSTHLQTENSIEYQLSKINEHSANNNIDIVAVFIDEAETGTNTEDREDFLNMVAAASRREFDVVVIYDVTRGSRDVGDWFSFRKTMKRLNIGVISVEDKLGDILNPNDFLVELLSVGIGQHSVLTSRQKSIDGVAVKAKQGAFLGGYAPIGYDIVEGKYVINERDANVVRTIFEMYAAGESYNAILDAIAGQKGKRGKPLGKNSIYSILKNERYIGVYTWNKRKVKQMRKWAGGELNPNVERIEDHIPPIIDMQTWERVDKRMKENRDNSKKASHRAKREYLLSGLIECELCGATFVGHTTVNKKGYAHSSYKCGNKYRTRTCAAGNGSAVELETFVVAQLREYFNTMDFTETAQKVADQVNAASVDLSKEKKEVAEITAKIANGVKVLMDMPDFKEMREEIDLLRIRKTELEDVIARNSVTTKKLDVNKLIEFFQLSAATFDENTKEAVKEHVTKIYAHADGSFTVNVGVNLGVVHATYCGGRNVINTKPKPRKSSVLCLGMPSYST